MTQAVVLARHPEGAVTEHDFEVIEMPVGDCPAGYFRTRNRVISLDAGFRQWMTAGAGDNYLTGMQVGDPVQSIVLGEVIESQHAEYPVGTFVSARTAWESPVCWMVQISAQHSSSTRLFRSISTWGS